MQDLKCVLVSLFATLILCSNACAKVTQGADHHIHVRSPEAREALVFLCGLYENLCGTEAAITKDSPSLADILKQLDAAGLDKGVLLSMAYLFGMPELSNTKFNDQKLVRAENSFVAQLAATAPDRIMGFISVNPLEDYAFEEVGYWLNKKTRLGLKLHFANSAVDLNNVDHLMKLRRLLELVNKHQSAVIVHIETRNREFGFADIGHFVDKVLVGLPNICIQAAHMGGSGGYDSVADRAIEAFTQAVENKRLNRKNLYFDIAAVGSNPMREDQIELLISRIREIGLDRILFGSDWDTFRTPSKIISLIREQLPLSNLEWDSLLSNEASYLRRKHCGGELSQ